VNVPILSAWSERHLDLRASPVIHKNQIEYAEAIEWAGLELRVPVTCPGLHPTARPTRWVTAT